MMKPIMLTAAIAALALAGCGGDDATTSAAAPEDVNTFTTTTPDESFAVSADPDGALAYTETELSVPAGSITVDFENPASIPHDVVVEDADGEELMRTETVSESSVTATAELEPGTYTFYCSVPGHRDAGMEGTLTVN